MDMSQRWHTNQSAAMQPHTWQTVIPNFFAFNTLTQGQHIYLLPDFNPTDFHIPLL